MKLPKVYSKYYSYVMLKEYPPLQKYLLETDRFTWEKCKAWLQKYKIIFIKPEYNNGGKGILRIATLDDHSYQITHQDQSVITSAVNVKKQISSWIDLGKPYVIQRGLQLAKINDSVIDFRLFSQKVDEEWSCPGMVAKIGAPRKYVTNLQSGGRSSPVEEILPMITDSKEKQAMLPQILAEVSNWCGEALHHYYPNLKEVAVDIGITRDLQLFIIEVNTHYPGTMLFKNLEDRTMFRKIWANRRKMGEWRNFPQFKNRNPLSQI